MSEYSALKEAIDTAMGKIKNAKNSIKSAINTAGASMHVHVDDTDTFRSYADAIRLMYQRIWSSDDDTDAPKKCIITNDDFPLAPMHNYGYIDINDLSADRFGDDKKYYAASSFIVDIQNPPVPIGSEDNFFIGYILSIEHGTTPVGPYPGSIPSDNYHTICGGLMENPDELHDSDIGRYILLSTDIYTFEGSWAAGDHDYIYSKFPGGVYASRTRCTEMNTKVTIFAYGKEETFEFLGRWTETGAHSLNGIWRRLTGGN